MNEDRKDRRFSRLMRGMMELPDRSGYQILIQNISAHGIGARFSTESLTAGTHVKIEVPGRGEFHGTIRWQKEERIGVELSEELDPANMSFHSDHLAAKEDGKYHVAVRFQPVTSSYRPGFGRK